jgi:type IV secretion system protein VirD4
MATQHVAAALHFAPQLGEPWMRTPTLRVYPPWAWITWQDAWARRAPAAFRDAAGISLLALVAGLVIVTATAARRRLTPPSTAHGSSRWATTPEVRKAGLLRDAGVVLCQTSEAAYRTIVRADGATKITLERSGPLVRQDGPEHVLCFAPTRSGKGVGLVVPTLLSWTHSVVVYDIKKENWSLTAGWRRRFSHTWRFEPTAVDSLRFNPLLEIRRGVTEIQDVQNVADILVDVRLPGEEDDGLPPRRARRFVHRSRA